MDDPIRAMDDGEADACEAILRSLPDWFGIEDAIVSYVKDLRTMETFVADVDSEVVGFLTLKAHFPASAEIHVMGVVETHHGRGLGRRLVEHAEALLRERGVQYLQVKTLAPSHPDRHYARTRGFYEHLGFVPLEENELWGRTNPCLIMVKHLSCPGSGS
jgi:GNAT superfamily N-acetyltransferase